MTNTIQQIMQLSSFLQQAGASPCSPRDSQESSPAPQFESINSLALSLLHGPTLTSIHDSWKNHSLTIWTFVSEVMSLLFNTQSYLCTAPHFSTFSQKEGLLPSLLLILLT